MGIWQRIKTKPAYKILLGVVMGVMIAHSCTKEEASLKNSSIDFSAQKMRSLLKFDPMESRLLKFFSASASPSPNAMTQAVLATSRPMLMAPIAKKESRGNPKAVGDRGESRGAFQVQSKHWGKVPSHPTKQAQQSEWILNELLAETGSLPVAVSRYNGTGSAAKRYVREITRESLELALLAN